MVALFWGVVGLVLAALSLARQLPVWIREGAAALSALAILILVWRLLGVYFSRLKQKPITLIEQYEKRIKVGVIALLGLLMMWIAPTIHSWYVPLIQSQVPIHLKIVQGPQILSDGRGGAYVVLPDVQLTNGGEVPTVINIELQVEIASGAWISFESTASRLSDIESWLGAHDLSNDNFLGRQIIVAPRAGVSGYMVFHADSTRLKMASLSMAHLRALRLLSLSIEQAGFAPRRMSLVEATIGHR